MRRRKRRKGEEERGVGGNRGQRRELRKNGLKAGGRDTEIERDRNRDRDVERHRKRDKGWKKMKYIK